MPRIYLDTNLFIHAVEGMDELSELCWQVLNLGSTGAASLVTSELTLAEVLVGPLKAQGQPALVRPAEVSEADKPRFRAGTVAAQYVDLLAGGEGLYVMPVSRDTLILAAHLRTVPPRPKLPDAIHMATAKQQACTHAISDDRGFRTAVAQSASPIELTVEGLSVLISGLRRA